MSLLQKFKTIFSIIVMAVMFFTLVLNESKSAILPTPLAPDLDPNMIPKFVNQLVIPPVFDPEVKSEGKGKVYHKYIVDITQFKQQILPPVDMDGNPLNPTTVWGYGGIVKKDPVTGKKGYFRNSPSATFEATQGIPVKVEWENKIKGNHLFPVDPTLHWANPNNMPMMPPMPWPSFPLGFQQAQSPVPLVPHLHGAEVSSSSDGNPNAWWTANGKRGPAFVTKEYTYPNQQNPTTLWYHDHTLGITRINVMSGLAGFYLVRSPNDTIEQKLPKGEYEVPLVIQDRSFRTDGSFLFETKGVLPDIHPYWSPEFFGNTIMVNGKVWPNFDVKKSQYRFRVLNGSNARFYDLKFSNGMSFIQIGSDGGYLPKPVSLTNLVLAPGERADILVDFSHTDPGNKIILQNSGKTPYPDGDDVDADTTGVIMQFSVKGKNKSSVPAVKLPNSLNSIPKLVPNKTRVLTLTEAMGTGENGEEAPVGGLLNGQTWDGNISELAQVGSSEEWQVVNLTGDTHPIHLHLVQFQVVGRYKLLDPGAYEKDWLELNKDGLTNQNGMTMLPLKNDYSVKELPTASYISKDIIPPTANELGWKDTVQMPPGEVTIIRFRVAPQNADPNKVTPGVNLYPFDPTVGPGYVWHCHILDHEDNEMMRPMKIIK
jgi:FtsP/CotA-like multicopper oxidase with cupredoxin domain